MKTEITRADILDLAAYERVRPERRAAARERQRLRQVAVGPFATFTFETYDSMWLQVHEMLRAEKGGEAQIGGELSAYNPRIPKGRERVATLMFEVEDAAQRARELSRLGGIEETVRLCFGAHRIAAQPERDAERSTAEGRTSSVHFMHFPFTEDQVRAFRAGGEVTLEFTHPRYRHAAGLADDVRAELARDFA